MTQLLNWINIKFSLKRLEASNRLREDTTKGKSVDRALCSNRCTVRGGLLQSISDNWLLGWYFRGKIREFEVKSYVFKCKSKVLISFFEYNWVLFWCIQTTYLLLYNRHTSCYKGHKIAKICFSTLQGTREDVSFHMFLKKMDPNYLEKEKSRAIMRKKKLLKNLYL